jgi:hypothetical protein
MPIQPGPNRDLIALNAAWRKKHQQKPNKDVHHDVIAAEKKPVIHPTTPQPPVIGNPECRECPVMKECRAVWKSTHRKNRENKPGLISAIVAFAGNHAGQMACLKECQPMTKIPPGWGK